MSFVSLPRNEFQLLVTRAFAAASGVTQRAVALEDCNVDTATETGETSYYESCFRVVVTKWAACRIVR